MEKVLRIWEDYILDIYIVYKLYCIYILYTKEHWKKEWN